MKMTKFALRAAGPADLFPQVRFAGRYYRGLGRGQRPVGAHQIR